MTRWLRFGSVAAATAVLLCGSRTASAQTHEKDVAAIARHMLERHLAGYPGGKSATEARFAARLAQARVSKAFLRRTADRIGVRPADAVSASVRALRVARPANLTTLRTTLCLQGHRQHRRDSALR